MRLLNLIFCLISVPALANTTTKKLSGTISRLKVGSTIVLSSFDSDGAIARTFSKDSTFSFYIEESKSNFYFIGYEDSTQRYAFGVYMDESDLHLDLRNNHSIIKFTGGKLAAEQTDYYFGFNKLNANLRKLQQEYALRKDSSVLKKLEQEQMIARSQFEEYSFNWISKNKNSAYALIVLYFDLNTADPDRLQKTFESISDKVKSNHIITSRIPDLIVKASENKMIGIGRKMPEFNLQDTHGKSVKFSDIKNYKFLVIDFWASWCGPCRASNPDIAALIKKYGDKQLKVVSISADDSRDNWLKAIKDDSMSWLQLSDLKGTEGGFTQAVSVFSFPTYLVIAEDGTIVAKPWNIDGVKEKLALEYGY